MPCLATQATARVMNVRFSRHIRTVSGYSSRIPSAMARSTKWCGPHQPKIADLAVSCPGRLHLSSYDVIIR
jgi:hypothetical protein